MRGAQPNILKAEAITRDAYAPYGDLIAASADLQFRTANFGRAQRFDFLSDVANLRPEKAPLNLCIFRCSPFTLPELTVEMLEKHPHSTQVFLPMQDGRFITVVALGSDAPELLTMRAFIVDAPCGISYKPGVWHYPMTALGKQLDMACLIFEDSSAEDCLTFSLPQSIAVKV